MPRLWGRARLRRRAAAFVGHVSVPVELMASKINNPDKKLVGRRFATRSHQFELEICTVMVEAMKFTRLRSRMGRRGLVARLVGPSSDAALSPFAVFGRHCCRVFLAKIFVCRTCRRRRPRRDILFGSYRSGPDSYAARSSSGDGARHHRSSSRGTESTPSGRWCTRQLGWHRSDFGHPRKMFWVVAMTIDWKYFGNPCEWQLTAAGRFLQYESEPWCRCAVHGVIGLNRKVAMNLLARGLDDWLVVVTVDGSWSSGMICCGEKSPMLRDGLTCNTPSETISHFMAAPVIKWIRKRMASDVE
jgi:hypothetical protein